MVRLTALWHLERIVMGSRELPDPVRQPGDRGQGRVGNGALRVPILAEDGEILLRFQAQPALVIRRSLSRLGGRAGSADRDRSSS